MSLAPGLLPEEGDSRRGRSPLLLGLVVLVALLLAGYAIRTYGRVQEESRIESGRLKELVRENARLREELRKPPLPVPVLPVPAAPPAPAPPPERRLLPPLSPEGVQERLTQGLHELRSGRFDQAERQFFRALPESVLYLALSSLAQGNIQESYAFLSLAMANVPHWLRKVKPRDLFGSEESYRALVGTLEARLAADPLDAEAKILLAYLRYHDQGEGHAKALVVEALQLKPGLEEGRRFMEALEP